MSEETANELLLRAKLAQKILKVMAAVRALPKNGYNKEGDYHYPTDADIAFACREAMIANNVIMQTSMVNIEDRLVQGNQGKVKPITRVHLRQTWIDTETGYAESVDTLGDGFDYGDKGVYKANTGAAKYGLIRNLILPSYDDPENDVPQLYTEGFGEKAELSAPYRKLRDLVKLNDVNEKTLCRPYGAESITEIPEDKLVEATERVVKLLEKRRAQTKE